MKRLKEKKSKTDVAINNRWGTWQVYIIWIIAAIIYRILVGRFIQNNEIPSDVWSEGMWILSGLAANLNMWLLLLLVPQKVQTIFLQLKYRLSNYELDPNWFDRSEATIAADNENQEDK